MKISKEANMDLHYKWQYDEKKQVGTDYGKPSEVESYDEKMVSSSNHRVNGTILKS